MTSLQAALNGQRQVEMHTRSISGMSRQFVVFQPVTGIGTVQFDCWFPVIFTERPVLSIGGELDDNERYVPATPPFITGSVLRWHAQTSADRMASDNNRLYRGARVGLVVHGHAADQRMIAHLTFTGVSVAGPGGQALGVGDTL